jgi:hypothetical protein
MCGIDTKREAQASSFLQEGELRTDWVWYRIAGKTQNRYVMVDH